MKPKQRDESRNSQIVFKSHTFQLSVAKTYLGRLADKARHGEPVYIVRGQDRFVLQHVPEIEPIPMRPPGYFNHCYSNEEIDEENSLSKDSVIRAPKDLE